MYMSPYLVSVPGTASSFDQLDLMRNIFWSAPGAHVDGNFTMQCYPCVGHSGDDFEQVVA